MKTKGWVLITLAIFIAAIGIAAETPKMNVTATEAKKTLVSFESSIACPVEITIRCEYGKVIYHWKSEKSQEKYDHVIDLSGATCGKYKVCVNYGAQSINRDIIIKRKGIDVGSAVQLFEPVFRYSDDRLNLSFLNIAQKNVYINIYQNGEYVTGINLGKSMDVQKSFDFSSLEKGEYEVVLSDYFAKHHYMVRK